VKLFAALLILLAPCAAVCQDVPMFRGNLAHTGVYDATGLPKFNAITWKFQTGDDPQAHNHVGIQGSPVVADNTVYFGCRDSFVYALDAASGALK
jgi:hypothetical protein